MQKVDLFKICSAERLPDPSIRLVRHDGTGIIEVDAVSLLAQYLLDNGDVLLVLDEDTPYEEQLHLALVRDATIVDHVVISGLYASGIFREEDVGTDHLTFRFEGEAVWTVKVHALGSRLPARLPSGARRRGGWMSRHHLAMSRKDAA